MERTVLCVGFLSDPTFQYATERFSDMTQRPPIVIDLGAARHGFWVHYEDAAPTCRIRTKQSDVTITREMSLFHRLISVTGHVRAGMRPWKGYRVAQYVFGRLLDEQFFDFVVNPLMAGWSNGIRPIHYKFLTSIGFHVPSWLVTTDPETAWRFLTFHQRDVFVKSVSYHRTISSRFSEIHARELDNVRHSPVLFQKAIHGPDVRIHVVGNHCFGLKISTRADDYRYPGDHRVEYTPINLPPTVSMLSVEATRQLGLRLAGIDMKICETTGEWYCLEINPMPGYAGYDKYLDSRISSALVKCLAWGGVA